MQEADSISAQRIAELEQRVRELESLTQRGRKKELEELWQKARASEDAPALLNLFRDVIKDRNIQFNRPQLHGMVDDLINSPIGADPQMIWTLIITSSEPCGIIVVTIISALGCEG